MANVDLVVNDSQQHCQWITANLLLSYSLTDVTLTQKKQKNVDIGDKSLVH